MQGPHLPTTLIVYDLVTQTSLPVFLACCHWEAVVLVLNGQRDERKAEEAQVAS